MLVVQQNCGKGYECTISALETALSLGASIVCIQEPFVGRRSISHSGFNLYWPSGFDHRKDIRVLTAVRKDIANEIIFESRSDLISHPYCMALDVKELHQKTSKVLRRTRVVNMYDNVIGRGHTWQGPTPVIRRAIQDICWNSVIRGRVLLVGDMNAHSPSWNPHCTRRQNAGPLEELIDKFELIVNNNTDFATRPASQGISIIDLALSTGNLGPLTLWEIPEEYPSLSDHELVLLQWDDLRSDIGTSARPISIGWNIQSLLDDKPRLDKAKDDWENQSSKRPSLNSSSNKDDLDLEVKWFETEISNFLDKHIKITCVTSYSKRWWNDKVSQARKGWAKERKRLSNTGNNVEELKKAKNAYYQVSRKAKRVR